MDRSNPNSYCIIAKCKDNVLENISRSSNHSAPSTSTLGRFQNSYGNSQRHKGLSLIKIQFLYKFSLDVLHTFHELVIRSISNWLRDNALRVKQTSKLYIFSLHIVSTKPTHKHAHYLQSCAGQFSPVHIMYSSIIITDLICSMTIYKIQLDKILRVENVTHSVIIKKKTFTAPHSLIKCL